MVTTSRYNWTYDAEGNQLTEAPTPASNGTSWVKRRTYDAAGNKIEDWSDSNGNGVFDGNDSRYNWTYDAEGNQLTEAQPLHQMAQAG